MIVTIDGPSGTGKSTVAKKVAERLGFPFFDTGAMYRAVAWGLNQENIPPSDEREVQSYLKTFAYDIRIQDGKERYYVNDTDVTDQIRTQQINEIVSEVSAHPSVRHAIWKLQRAYAKRQSAVFEGRDMGTAVFPKAEVKIYLDASPEIRAKRRLEEMRSKAPSDAAHFDEEKMKQDLLRRDEYDAGRKLAPLKCPRKALRIDTSQLTIDQVVDKIVNHHHKQTEKLLPTWKSPSKMPPLYRFIIFLAWLFFKLFQRHKVYGLEHFVKRAAIIAPNHTSYLDPPITAISWPLEVHFLGKKELFKNALFGRFISAVNCHPVSGDVGDVSVFKTIIGLLKEGKQLILFPEGGRTNGELGEIKPGIGMFVMRTKGAIIPTYIHGAHEVWGRDRKFPKFFGKTACVFGTPIIWESFSHLDKKKAQVEIAECLSKALRDLKSWYESGADGIPP